MENPLMNQRPSKQMQPWAVIDVNNGIEVFSGSEQECIAYAEDPDTGRIAPNLSLCPIF